MTGIENEETRMSTSFRSQKKADPKQVFENIILFKIKGLDT
jgi:hypothetical protein